MTPVHHLHAAQPKTIAGLEPHSEATAAPGSYQRDVWERSILFLDTLRQRADNMRDHERAGMPPLSEPI